MFLFKALHGILTLFLIIYVSVILAHLSITSLESVRDLGPLSYFLGVEIVPTTDALFLLLYKYIYILLEKANMCEPKKSNTLSFIETFYLNDGVPSIDTTQYW